MVGARWALIAALLIAPAAHAGVATLAPQRDTSVFSESDNSNGAGGGLFVGRNSSGNVRRSLLAFDIASAIPFGARIDAVSLTLRLDGISSSENMARPVDLHRVLADWGEGDSNPGTGGGSGGGGEPGPGDATWNFRFYSSAAWNAPGGDYAATPSASTLVGTEFDFYTWTSAALAADVQAWLDAPPTNFGWELIGNETFNGSSRRFSSREAATLEFRPSLEVVYTERPPGDATGDFCVTGADYTIWADNFGTTGATVNQADFNGDSLVTGADFTIWADNFGACAALPAPEPGGWALALTAGAVGFLVGVRRVPRAR